MSHAYKKKGKYTPSVKVMNSIGDVVTVKLPTITVTA